MYEAALRPSYSKSVDITVMPSATTCFINLRSMPGRKLGYGGNMIQSLKISQAAVEIKPVDRLLLAPGWTGTITSYA